MIEAGRQFRRVNGHLHLAALQAALEADVAKTAGPLLPDKGSDAA
jgi:putative transposase